MAKTSLGGILAAYSLMFAVVFGISAIIGGFCWPYTVNTWLVFFDKEPIMVFWQGAVMGLVPLVGQTSLPVAVITWVLMLFLV